MSIRRIGAGCLSVVCALLALQAASVAWADEVLPFPPLPTPGGADGEPDLRPGAVLRTIVLREDAPPAPTFAPSAPAPDAFFPDPPEPLAPPAPPEGQADPAPPAVALAPTPRRPRLVRRARPVAVGQPGSCDCPLWQARDANCWSLDWCGKRYGCREVTVEGVGALFSGPEGLMGPSGFAGGAPQFDWSNIERSPTWGVRVTARYQFEAQSWVELRGLYLAEVDDAAAQTGSVFGFGAGPTASAVLTAALSTSASLWGGELNLATELGGDGRWHWDLVAGARVLRFDETARASFLGAAAPAPVGAGAFVDADVDNTFIGGQAGVAVHYDVSRRVDTTLGVKALAGNVSREATVTDANVFVGGPHAGTSSMDEVTFGLDIDVAARLRLTPRIAVTLGYNLLFLDNVLRANDAMDFTKNLSGAVQPRQLLNQLIVHSVFAGVNVNF